MEESRPARFKGLAQGRLELFVTSDGQTEHAAGFSDRGEVNRPKSRGQSGGRAALFLMAPYRPVPAVVHDESDDMSPFPYGRL